MGAGGITLESTSGNVVIGQEGFGRVRVVLGASQTWTNDSATKTLTLVDIISGTGNGITKEGIGTIILNGANTYSGATTVNGGKLISTLTGDLLNSEVVVNDVSATFGVSIGNTTDSLVCDALTAAAAGTLEFNFGALAPSESNAPLSVTNLADFSTATPTVSILVDSGLAPGTYPLMTWGSVAGTPPTTTELTVSTVSPGTEAALSVDGSTLNLVISSNASDIVKANNTDDLNLGSSWVGGTAPTLADVAIWDNTVTSPNSTVLGADVGFGGLKIVDPAGSVTIGGANTLTLGAGALDIDMSAATQDLTLNCDLGLGAANVWDVASGRTLTVGGLIFGSSSITTQGAGSVVLSTPSLHTGDTNIAAGTFRLGAADVIPDGAGNGSLTVDGTLDLNGNSETVNGPSGSGTVDNSLASTSSTLSVGANDTSSTFSGVFQNSGGTLNLTKIGTGTLTLGGANTFSGSVAVNGGTLAFSNVAPFDNVTGISLADGTVLRPAVDGATLTAPITLGAAATTAQINAPSTGGSGQLQTLTLNGPIGGDGDLLLFGSAGANTAGTIVIGAQGTYLGNTTLDTAGGANSGQQLYVKAGVANALPTTTVLTLDGGPGSGSGRTVRYDLNGNDQTLAGLTNITGLSARRQEIHNTGAPATLTVDSDVDYSFGGSTSGTFNGNPWTARSRILGDISLVKSGTGTFTLVEIHSYTGDTTVNEGILVLEAPNTSNETSTTTVAPGGQLQLTFAGTDTVGALVINGTPQGPGVYGHTDSGADNGGQGVGFFDASFEPGTGSITLLAGFSSWITGTFANGTVTNQGPDDDDDGDGISNLLEYAIDGEDPTVPNASIGSFDGTTLSFSKRADTTGLVYAIEESTDLGLVDLWEEVSGGSYVNNATTISYTMPGGPGTNFLRLKVTQN